jgi:hypothetical protein
VDELVHIARLALCLHAEGMFILIPNKTFDPETLRRVHGCRPERGSPDIAVDFNLVSYHRTPFLFHFFIFSVSLCETSVSHRVIFLHVNKFISDASAFLSQNGTLISQKSTFPESCFSVSQ